MNDPECVDLLQWALPRLRMRWRGFRKPRRQVRRRIERRIRSLGLADAGAYRTYLQRHDEEWFELDQMCRISISQFYRNRAVFDCLGQQILPDLARLVQRRGGRELSCWSAGCASGEEVYTLKLIWELSLRPRFPELSLRIIGTDSEPHMIERAKAACYPPSSVKELAAAWIAEAFIVEGETYYLKDEFRRTVEFVEQDIRREMPEGLFDLILCRNMAFTYFDESLQRRVALRLASELQPGGALVVGKHESLPGDLPGMVPYGSSLSIYRCADTKRTDREN